MASVVLDGAGTPAAPSSPDDDGGYACDCPGFTFKQVERMCLRCLAAYADGLPHVLSGYALTREMQRVAVALKRNIEGDPALARLSVATVLRAAERT